jgi:hypothetical protein
LHTLTVQVARGAEFEGEQVEQDGGLAFLSAFLTPFLTPFLSAFLPTFLTPFLKTPR